MLLLESGGDNLTATFSKGLVDVQVFVLDVAGGEKVPRKGGPGITGADLLVINKTDLAPLVGADLGVMAADAERVREGRPTVLVSLHSFTPVYAGLARPWHVGTLYHRDTRLPPLLLQLFRGEGDLVVGDNEPYAVSDQTDYTIPVHGEARGLMNSGIEIRQDLIADQAGERQWADRLARIFAEVEATLIKPTASHL